MTQEQLLKDILKQLEKLNEKQDRFLAKMMFDKCMAKIDNNPWFQSRQADEEFKRFLEQNDADKQSDK